MKLCVKCNLIKDEKEFNKYWHKKPSLRKYCKKCGTLITQENRSKDPKKYKKQCDKQNKRLKEYQRNWKLKKEYGISLEQFDNILLIQNNKCKICKNVQQTKTKKHLCVDHCHKTGKIRGLLCDSCNKGLSNFKDNINLLNTAIEYLNNN